MKKAIGLFAILVLMALVFTSCGAGGTAYKCTEGSYTETYTFKSDNTWEYSAKGTEDGTSYDLVIASGTYTGDPKKDGTLTLKCTKIVNLTSFASSTATKITNSNFPLESCAEFSYASFNVSNGQFTHGGETFKK